MSPRSQIAFFGVLSVSVLAFVLVANQHRNSQQRDLQLGDSEQEHWEAAGSPGSEIETTESNRRRVKFGKPNREGKLRSQLINESSGLAVSLANAWGDSETVPVYWTHNDNGPFPGLFLIGQNGTLLARLDLKGVPHRDWESIDSVRFQDRNWLVLANVGDNLAQHETCQLYIFEEPKLDLPDQLNGNDDSFSKAKIEPQAIIEFSYPNGPCDCEAMAVDVRSNQVLFFTKNSGNQTNNETHLYSVPWSIESTDEPVTATEIESDFDEPLITGMAFNAEGSLAVVRTYLTAWIFERSANQSWAQAFQGKPLGRTLLPIQKQGEAICFAQSPERLVFTSEGIGETIWSLSIELNDEIAQETKSNSEKKR